MATSYHRPKNKDRLTPYYDAWRVDLEFALAARGAKTKLAMFLARKDQSNLQRWQVAICKYLTAKHIPDAEFVLAVNDWLEIQKKPRARPRNTDGKTSGA